MSGAAIARALTSGNTCRSRHEAQQVRLLQVAAVGARLLCRLRAYEQAASFQVCLCMFIQALNAPNAGLFEAPWPPWLSTCSVRAVA